MRIISRAIFKEVALNAGLGSGLFIFVLYLRKIEQLSAMLVRSSAPTMVSAKLFLYALPATLPFALPLGVLVGILIGLSRMSADSEITALRAAGISSVTIARPVMLFAFLALVITALAALWLTPLSLNLETKTAHTFAAAQLTGNIESRIFDEDFPDTVLYVSDVQTEEKQTIWRGVFIADVTPPEKLQVEGKNRGEGPRIITAAEAIPYPDQENNRIILDMHDFRSTERDKEGKAVTTYAQRHQWVLQAQKQEDLQVNKTVAQMDTGPLYKYIHKRDLSPKDIVDGTIELNQRFALPLACIMLALVGIPLGVTSRKGGKSSAYVVTVLVAFLYYMSYASLLGLARSGRVAVPVAAWTPGTVYAIAGTFLLSRLERPGDFDLGAWLNAQGLRVWKWLQNLLRTSTESVGRPLSARGFGLRPMLIDGYVLNGFLFYFGILLVALVSLVEIFTFFELLGDMIKNDISMTTMIDYLWHLAPSLIYQVTPIGTLAASLICFTILTKYNEVTAFKAAGVSVHRLAAPVMFASLVISLLLFGFDHFYIPAANRRQEMLRAEIKKKPVATYRRPDRQWVYGQGNRIFNFLHLDPKQNLMSKVNVFELDPKTFQIAHQITADRAQWNDRLHKWVFENGVSQETTATGSNYKQFANATATFAELTETPSWFVKEEKEYKELNFQELGSYIDELQASGLDTTPLRVQWHKKFSVPLFAFIMAILSIPFAFVGGTRGAMRGVLTAFIIAIVYWTVGTIFEQFGDLNLLPAAMAAWAPDVIFMLGGMYFMLRMKT
jgi:LPS export ABC transporter permease LptG/LPS export ABC transporter permease LptF